ncbi:MAG: RrF2 family transcriptional regulator [Eubacteriaceae bacterium]|jgi:Rrf2 family iron-sulfur cluster assembly transcriptional regulator
MMVSTKGRYALRVMIDLAENNTGEYIPLKDIAERQEISKKYLESIMTLLSKSGLITALHGKGGGYKLNRSPSDYSVGSILKVTEKTLAPVSCLECEPNTCPRASSCKTLPMWTQLNTMVDSFLEGISIEDLIREEDVGDYVI